MPPPRSPPPEATAYLPGTLDKLDVFVARHAAGFLLYHPEDARMDCHDKLRVPVLRPDKSRIKGWHVVDEREYRRTNHHEAFWEEQGSV